MGSEFGPVPGSKELSLRQKIALGAVVSGAFFVLYELNNDDNNREARTEECVGELIGRPVDLNMNPRTGQLQRPADIYDEVTACLESNGDSDEAKIIIDD